MQFRSRPLSHLSISSLTSPSPVNTASLRPHRKHLPQPEPCPGKVRRNHAPCFVPPDPHALISTHWVMRLVLCPWSTRLVLCSLVHTSCFVLTGSRSLFIPEVLQMRCTAVMTCSVVLYVASGPVYAQRELPVYPVQSSISHAQEDSPGAY